MEINILTSKEETAKAFVDFLVKRIATSKKMNIALSGGSTPKLVFDLLASSYRDKINWSKVFFYWGDERCVPPTDTQSNYGMTNQYLLSQVAIPAANIFRIKGESQPSLEVERYSSLLDKNLPSIGDVPQFDLVILGLGDDGHTASIFPHQINLWYSETNCAVAEHPETKQKRITITGKIINASTEVVFLVTGENKAAKVSDLINKNGGYLSYPAHLVKPESKQLYWYLDQEAANRL